MPKDCPLTGFKKFQILEMKNANLSQRMISEKIKRSKTLILNFLKDFENYGILKRTEQKNLLENCVKGQVIQSALFKSISCAKIMTDLNLKVLR